MSNLYVTEFAGPAQNFGTVQVAQTPVVAEQVISFTGTAGTSAAFNARTRMVRIHVDGIASLQFGASPTATTSMMRLTAGQTEYFGVTAGQKVSAVTNT